MAALRARPGGVGGGLGRRGTRHLRHQALGVWHRGGHHLVGALPPRHHALAGGAVRLHQVSHRVGPAAQSTRERGHQAAARGDGSAMQPGSSVAEGRTGRAGGKGVRSAAEGQRRQSSRPPLHVRQCVHKVAAEGALEAGISLQQGERRATAGTRGRPCNRAARPPVPGARNACCDNVDGKETWTNPP
jgi:hypothetical protein